jgi:hypothetical protein
MASEKSGEKSGTKATLAWLLELFKGILVVLASGAFLYLFFVDFDDLRDASKSILKRVGSSTTQLKIGIAEITIDDTTVSKILAQFAGAESSSPEVAHKIETLTPDEYERMMQVGLTKLTCDFETPSSEIRAFVALDYALAEKGLVTITPKPSSTADVAAVNERKYELGESNNGRPLDCYDLALTTIGARVRTTLVKTFEGAFDPIREIASRPARSMRRAKAP